MRPTSVQPMQLKLSQSTIAIQRRTPTDTIITVQYVSKCNRVWALDIPIVLIRSDPIDSSLPEMKQNINPNRAPNCQKVAIMSSLQCPLTSARAPVRLGLGIRARPIPVGRAHSVSSVPSHQCGPQCKCKVKSKVSGFSPGLTRRHVADSFRARAAAGAASPAPAPASPPGENSTLKNWVNAWKASDVPYGLLCLLVL